MSDDETLSDWVGEDAAQRFTKIPPADVPRIMDWIMDLRDMTDDELIQETESVLTGIQLGPLNPAPDHDEFKNAALHYEAQERHHEDGHDNDCLADTLYTQALRNISGSAAHAPTLPCSCGGVELPAPWEELRRTYTRHGWAVSLLHTPQGAWLDIRRDDDRMALYRAYNGDPDHDRHLVFDHTRRQWLHTRHTHHVDLASMDSDDLRASVAALSLTRSAAPPISILKHDSDARYKPESLAATLKRTPLPVPLNNLTPEEERDVRHLLALPDDDFHTELAAWLTQKPFNLHVMLSADLAHRTRRHLPCLNHLIKPRSNARRRRAAILKALTTAGIGPYTADELRQQAEEKARQAQERKEAKTAKKKAAQAAKTPGPAHPQSIPLDQRPATPRNEAYRLLINLFPDEYARLREALAENQALRQLKADHYDEYSRLLHGLRAGTDPQQLLDR